IVLGGYEFRFIDTAGIRETSETVERMGIERSFRSLSAADIVIIVLDASADGFDQMENLSMILHRLDGSAQKAVIFLNKADLVDEEGLNKNVTMINKNVLSFENKIDLLIASAKDENDVQRLREWLIAYESSRINHQNSTLITNQRHYDALVSASGSLEKVRCGLASSLPSDLLAEDLRAALSHLGSITGEITTAETLNHIFAKHCIGK
ncbi:MAG: 50S ribosome-binding GTPase, partial [Bacteroidales bacterium]|nr:50S ribosome-binding GTPase [Bacteroidales bacterium]